jgi:tetratricopeptide (TPR) repeat protein
MVGRSLWSCQFVVLGLTVFAPVSLFGASKHEQTAATAPDAKKDQCAPEPGDAPPPLPAKLMEGQGTVHFPITTSSEEAQKFFDQGVAQMHSFWAREAERSFLQAAALDPAAPMPWWGVAMVAAGDYRPGFQLDFVNGVPVGKQSLPSVVPPNAGKKRATDAAQRALDLSKTPGKASDLEKLYVASIAMRRGIGTQTPTADYVAGLRKILATSPNEVEAKSYLALILESGFTTPDKQPREGSMEAVTLLKELLVAAPNHPGVHHYVIHGWEGSTFASDAWPSCKRYAELVTNIPHALHMPGHIYAQTGRWDDAGAAFEAAAKLERSYMAEDSLYSPGHHGHNVHFEIVTLNFEGQYQRSIDLAHELMAIPETPRQKADADDWYAADRQGWVGLMRTQVTFEKWEAVLDSSQLPPPVNPRELAWYHWARSLAYSHSRNSNLAKDELSQMDKWLKAWREAAKKKDAPPNLMVARKEAEAQIAFAQGRDHEAWKLFDQASTEERALRYQEPPTYPRPVAQEAGTLALQRGQNNRAAKYFEIALEQYPRSRWAEQGLRTAKGVQPGLETATAQALGDGARLQ